MTRAIKLVFGWIVAAAIMIPVFGFEEMNDTYQEKKKEKKPDDPTR